MCPVWSQRAAWMIWYDVVLHQQIVWFSDKKRKKKTHWEGAVRCCSSKCTRNILNLDRKHLVCTNMLLKAYLSMLLIRIREAFLHPWSPQRIPVWRGLHKIISIIALIFVQICESIQQPPRVSFSLVKLEERRKTRFRMLMKLNEQLENQPQKYQNTNSSFKTIRLKHNFQTTNPSPSAYYHIYILQIDSDQYEITKRQEMLNMFEVILNCCAP